MTTPTEYDWERLKRAGRFLEGKSPLQECISLASKKEREAQAADRLGLGE